MTLPPPVIDSTRVLEFAHVEADVVYANRIRLNVGSEWLGPVENLAISRNYASPDDILLLFCDGSWCVKGVIPFTAVNEAKAKAEVGYIGIGRHWQVHPASDAEVDRFLAESYEVDPATEWWKTFCSFCGKESAEFSGMFKSEKAVICFDCVLELSDEIRRGDDG